MNGFECLDFFRSNPTRLPDAVLLDVMMPGMDGFEVCSKLRSPEGQFALGPSELPIIMLSAREPVPSSIIQGLLSGSNDCASVRPSRPSVRPSVRSFVASVYLFAVHCTAFPLGPHSFRLFYSKPASNLSRIGFDTSSL